MKYIKLFEQQTEDYNKNLDLRKMTKYCICVKNYKNIFIKGDFYKINGYYGDPQGATEKYKLNYVPIVLISAIIVVDRSNKSHIFKNTNASFINRYTTNSVGDFWEHFRLLTPEEIVFYDEIDKYNL